MGKTGKIITESVESTMKKAFQLDAIIIKMDKMMYFGAYYIDLNPKITCTFALYMS